MKRRSTYQRPDDGLPLVIGLALVTFTLTATVFAVIIR